MTESNPTLTGWLAPLAHRVMPMALLLVLVFLPMSQLEAQVSDPEAPLQIQKRFLRSARFIYRGGEPQNVSGLLSYSEDFTDLLGKHPTALEEAQKASVYQVTALVGSVGMLAVSVKMLIETINDANDVSSGTITSDTGTTSWTDVGLLAGFGAVMVVSGLKANSHLNRAIQIFNEQDSSMDRENWTPKLTVGLRPLDGGRALALGLSFNW